ncbi:siderophore-iron reductase FhuF [Roseomonas elaeocarpi]|uniref:Siderophore-iron reductase FhuF n=1 Tax=Roseomonas elaeocarpi TaxID=907779 RepID=A0ABV6JYS6_9PROT
MSTPQADHGRLASALPALAELLQGPLEFARESLVLGETVPGALPCRELLRPEVLREVLNRYATRYPGRNRRAVVSLWTQAYALRLIYPVVAANLALHRQLPVSIEEACILLDPQGTPLGFELPHAGEELAETSCFGCCAALLDHHLTPLARALAEAGELGERLFWSNVSVRVAGTIRLLRNVRADMGGEELLSSRCRPDGTENPLYRTLQPRSCELGCTLRRRVCCLRYMLPGLETGCGESCPMSACDRVPEKAALN